MTTPTWNGHLYSCRYSYPNGYFTLSVKELSSWSETFAYFRRLRSELGRVSTFPRLGQGGFSTTNGSVVVRKDWKVLLVAQRIGERSRDQRLRQSMSLAMSSRATARAN